MKCFSLNAVRVRAVGVRTCAAAIAILAASINVPTAIGQDRGQASVGQTAAPAALADEIGSLRNAQVAFPQSAAPTTLTFFAGSIDSTTAERLRSAAPNIRIVTGLTAAEALARAEEAHGIDARYATPAFLQKATNLVWVQAMHAGVERLVGLERIAGDDTVVLTNYRGVHGPAIADHAMAMLLSVTRQLPHYAAADADRRGAPSGTYGRPIALDGKTMLVVGLGGIGSEIAQRANGFGMRVIGTRRSDSPSPAYIEKVGKPDELQAMIAEADVVAIAVPLTAETEQLFDEKLFAAMKPGSYLVNIARGQIVDTAAMMRALHSGKLAGVCLDVTDPEPLPSQHPLRSLPNVIITPHMAGMSETTATRGAALLEENLRRFSAGEPLMNVVDKAVGY